MVFSKEYIKWRESDKSQYTPEENARFREQDAKIVAFCSRQAQYRINEEEKRKKIITEYLAQNQLIQGIFDGILDGRKEIYNPTYFYGEAQTIAMLMNYLYSMYKKEHRDKRYY